MSTSSSPIQQASVLLRALQADFDRGSSDSADDLLLFLYRLRDGHVILRSASKYVPGRTFSVLGDLIHSLESDPAGALQSPEQRSLILGLLSDLAGGRIVVKALR